MNIPPDIDFPLILAAFFIGTVWGLIAGSIYGNWNEHKAYRRGMRDAALNYKGITEEQLQANRALELWQKERRRMLADGQYLRVAK